MFSKLNRNLLYRLNVRLTVYYTCILLCLFALMATFFLYRLQHNFTKYTDQILRDELSELYHEIEERGSLIAGANTSAKLEALVQSCEEFEETVAKRKQFRLHFQVFDHAETLLYSSNTSKQSKPGKQFAFPALRTGENDFFTYDPGRRAPFRCYQKKVTLNGEGQFIIQMVTSTRKTNEIFERMLRNSLVAMVFVVFFSIFFGLYVSYKPFAAMRRINNLTKKITARDMSDRIPVPKLNDEVKNLTQTINDMLDRLEKSFAEVMQFSADAAHELRTPVFAVKGELEVMLSDVRSNEEYREMAETCLERINGLEKIINDLFLVSRFDLKKIPLDLAPANFSELLRDLHAFFLPIAQEKHLDFTLDVSGEDVVCKVDTTHMQQLISNLIDNAIKFTPEHGSIKVSLKRKKGLLEIRVSDTGIGIPEEKIPHIFKRFYQIDSARSGNNRGAGLGLQICQRITEAHNGTIAVQRNPEKGVTFIVELPVSTT